MIGKITVQEAAAVLHVSQQFVRIGMQERVLPIGTALKMSSKWTYNITEGTQTAEEIEAIQYGAQIPDKYKSKVLKDYETAMGACKA